MKKVRFMERKEIHQGLKGCILRKVMIENPQKGVVDTVLSTIGIILLRDLMKEVDEKLMRCLKLVK